MAFDAVTEYQAEGGVEVGTGVRLADAWRIGT